MYCKDFSLVKHDPKGASIQPLYCRSWKCEECAPRRARALQMEAMSGNPNRFLTLTINTKLFDTRDGAAQALAGALPKLRRILMRYYKLQSLPFLAIFERTENGWPHLHILLRTGYIHQKVISRLMGKLIGSPIVDIRKVTTAKGAARYVSKYITKAAHRFVGVKRYWSSQDWILPERKWEPPVADAGQTVAKREIPTWAVAQEFLRAGWAVTCGNPTPDHWYAVNPLGLGP